MSEFWFPVIRTFISFLVLIFVTYFVGKHINSHKNHYSFALSVTVGSFIANMGFDTEHPFKEMFISFLVLVLTFYLFLSLSFKSRKFRTWISGSPTVLIEHGKLLDENMKKVKFSIDDLNQHLREFGVFDINQVEYALLEVSGVVSIKRKERYEPFSKWDGSVPSAASTTIPVELIMEGRLIHENFTPQYDERWLNDELEKRKVKVGHIYFAVVNTKGNLFIDLYEDRLHSPSDME
ncbi:DUF421 domain-containing protein [Rossellomorea aquimaris]|uniref:DUF421 domain-containing protein n=1 Tax=Rossellomorea aquimaris TaxID=189382 RepID=UPI001CD7B218|nr:DUF421 domain-containing protein [Rossellomorea aquimaris]MCA1053977.1 DUF421 domain-containing protein [Rossellomorea aquimaris]